MKEEEKRNANYYFSFILIIICNNSTTKQKKIKNSFKILYPAFMRLLFFFYIGFKQIYIYKDIHIYSI